MKLKKIGARLGLWLLFLPLQAPGGLVWAAGAYPQGSGVAIGLFNLGGYSNLVLDAPHGGPDRLLLENLSALISGHVNRYLNPFLEAEVEGTRLIGNRGGAHAETAVVERLYDDLALSPTASLRVGKMLTPVGEWNLIHAAPLVWTVDRPLSTYYSFPQFVTGASLNLRGLSSLWDAQFYVQPGRDVFDQGEYQPRRYRRVAGLNLRYSWDLQNRLGLSVQSADIPPFGGHQLLISVYGGFTTGPLMWDFQADTTTIRSGATREVRDHERGGFIQAVYPLSARWFIVGQAEAFLPRDYASSVRRWVIGTVYRPIPTMAWKLEYLNARGAPIGSPSGIYAAWAVLF